MAFLRLIITVALGAFSFIPFFSQVTHLPQAGAGAEPGVQSSVFHFSMASNLFESGTGTGILAILMIAALLASAVLAILTLVMKDNKTVALISRIVFWTAVILVVIGFWCGTRGRA